MAENNLIMTKGSIFSCLSFLTGFLQNPMSASAGRRKEAELRRSDLDEPLWKRTAGDPQRPVEHWLRRRVASLQPQMMKSREAESLCPHKDSSLLLSGWCELQRLAL